MKTPDANGAHPLEGVPVALSNVLVTATTPSGFFIQVQESEPGYLGPDYSGLFVSSSGAPVAAGDRVDIASAQLSNDGLREVLGSVAGLSVVSSANALPAPVVATSTDLADTGSRAAALESVLVEVQGVTVTDVQPPLGAGDQAPANDFVIDSGVRVDDELYLLQPQVQLGEVFTSITGILDDVYSHYRIEPRSAADYVAGPAQLVGFGPTPTFTRVAMSGSTIPQPLFLTIARAQSTDTTVQVTPQNGDLVVLNGGVVVIPAGQVSAEVKVEGLNADPDVPLLATVNQSVVQADVYVLGYGNGSDLASLTPSTASARPGDFVTFTVTLSVPPSTDTTVDLAINPPSGFGTTAQTVTVPHDQLSATFDVSLDASALGSATLTASLNGNSLSATVTATTGG